MLPSSGAGRRLSKQRNMGVHALRGRGGTVRLWGPRGGRIAFPAREEGPDPVQPGKITRRGIALNVVWVVGKKKRDAGCSCQSRIDGGESGGEARYESPEIARLTRLSGPDGRH